MRLSPSHSVYSSSLILLLPYLTSGLSIDCEHVRAGNENYNLQSLDGPHAIWTIEKHPPTYTNTTFTVDICRPLKKTKGVPKDEDCPNGSRVCAIERLYSPAGEDVDPRVEKTVPIAGEFSTSSGGALDPKWSKLKDQDGIQLELNGGNYVKQKQKAVIDFLCQKDGATERRDEGEKSGLDDIDEEAGKEQDDGQGGKLKYISWDVEKDDVRVLKLEWTTKAACEGNTGSSGGSSSSHWGFFTWLIIILFLGIATYLIFGSWLNYNRHSARGWDVLPHSDTIQDLPYLFRDWVRRVINTVQGGGSRGGYSAV